MDRHGPSQSERQLRIGAYGRGYDSLLFSIPLVLDPFPRFSLDVDVALEWARFDLHPGRLLGVAPEWAKDGREIYYLEAARLMAVPFNPAPDTLLGRPEHLFDLQPRYVVPGRNFGRVYASTADGQFMMIAESEDGPETGEIEEPRIVVVQNWFEELKRRVPTGRQR